MIRRALLGHIAALLISANAWGASAYDTVVLGNPPTSFWTFGDTAGSTTAADTAGSNNLTASNITFGAATIISGDTETSATFNGTSSCASSTASVFNFERTQSFSIDAWISLSYSGASRSDTIASKISTSAPFPGWAFQVDWNGSTASNLRFYGINSYNTNTLEITTPVNIANGTHHVILQYNGSTSPNVNSVFMWVDGVPQSNTLVNGGLTASILNSAVFSVGCRSATSSPGFFAQFTIQKLAVYVGLPQFPGAELLYHYSAGVNRTFPTLPANPQVILVDDGVGDIDDYADNLLMLRLKAQGFNVLGMVQCDGSVYSATTSQAGMNFLGTSVPFYAYQGTDLPSGLGQYGAVADKFLPADATNVGLISGTVTTPGGSGGAYVVGDILNVPGGTSAGRTAQVIVNSVSGGGIATFSFYDSGTYSAAPPSPATLPNPHAGTSAVITFSTSARRGNYTDALVGYRRLLHGATDGNVVTIEGGPAKCTDDLLNSPGDGIDARTGRQLMLAKEAAHLWVWGFWPSNAYWLTGSESNVNCNAACLAASRDIAANWPATIPAVIIGIELVQPVGGVTGNPTTGPQPTTGASAINPFQDAFNDAGFLSRQAWSQIGILMVRQGGLGSQFRPGGIGGSISIDASGNNSWSGTSGPWSFIQIPGSLASVGMTLENIEWPLPGAGKGRLPLLGVGSLFPANDNLERRMKRLVAGRSR